MKRILLFLVVLCIFFVAGFFLDVVFHFWGVLFNIVLIWFFIFASYWLRPHEILYAGVLVGLVNSFFAAGSVWFWLLSFIAVSFVILGVRFFVSVSGRLEFLYFSFASWVGAVVVRVAGIFFAGTYEPAYGTVWKYVVSPFFGWEIYLSTALFFCIGMFIYFTHRSEHSYYI